jgi:hypothetical protein
VAPTNGRFWTIADLAQRVEGWRPRSAVYTWPRTIEIRGALWKVVHAVFVQVESEPKSGRSRCTIEATVTVWPPVAPFDRNRPMPRSLVQDMLGLGYEGEPESLKLRGFVNFTKALPTPTQVFEEVRRIERAAGRPNHRSHVVSSKPSNRTRRPTDGLAAFWAVSEHMREEAVSFGGTQASYASPFTISKAGQVWFVEFTFDVNLAPGSENFSPPFSSGIWIHIPRALKAAEAERVLTSGVYKSFFLDFAHKGLHGRWSARDNATTLSGRFEKFMWSLPQARHEVKQLQRLREQLLQDASGKSA